MESQICESNMRLGAGIYEHVCVFKYICYGVLVDGFREDKQR